MKLTPKDHHDRLALQIALTELDTLTHRLNATKHVSENRLEAKRLLSRFSGRHSIKVDPVKTYMVRHDDMIQIVGIFLFARVPASLYCKHILQIIGHRLQMKPWLLFPRNVWCVLKNNKLVRPE